MKKVLTFLVCIMLLSSLQVLGEDSECENNSKPECPQMSTTDKCDRFLCTNTEIETIFNEIGLSDSQICTARKLQEKYEQETLSVNDRLAYEENVLNEYNATCANNSDKREQKKKIRNLKRTRKDICKCYEKQFKVMLSNAQWNEYKKYRTK